MRLDFNKKLHLNEDIFSVQSDKGSPRQGFGDALVELGKDHKDVVVLTADLKESTKTSGFAEEFPTRFFETGIAEQNMAGIAIGLASSGKTPFITSFGAFSPGRNWEQIKMICYSNLNVKIVGTHSGLSAASDGPTQQSLADIALTRVLPNMTVIEPMDYHQTVEAVKEAIKIKGPVYLRLNRNDVPNITTSKTPFSVGTSQVLIEGQDAVVISCGSVTYQAIRAARELLLKNKIGLQVVNMATIKPLDENMLLELSKKFSHVITLEEHQIAGGMGSAVAEFLSENTSSKVTRIGIKDTFGESGEYSELLDKYGLSSAHIEKQVKKFLGVKG